MKRITWTPENVRALRLWARESKASMARRIGVSWFAVNAWESGLRAPSPPNLKALDRIAEDEHFASD